MYSFAIRKGRKNVIMAWKELRSLDPSRQFFVKYPTKLMVRKTGEKEDILHGEY